MLARDITGGQQCDQTSSPCHCKGEQSRSVVDDENSKHNDEHQQKAHTSKHAIPPTVPRVCKAQQGIGGKTMGHRVHCCKDRKQASVRACEPKDESCGKDKKRTWQPAKRSQMSCGPSVVHEACRIADTPRSSIDDGHNLNHRSCPIHQSIFIGPHDFGACRFCQKRHNFRTFNVWTAHHQCHRSLRCQHVCSTGEHHAGRHDEDDIAQCNILGCRFKAGKRKYTNIDNGIQHIC
mmetsp:Transcript_68229/g.118844  ORF Transcript_68229/g.118844 Transcript_68229/m.118844 type:complete len:235 (-) Transcript_68229:702-1406(-)